MKTTINIDEVLFNRIKKHLEITGETQTEFFTKSFVNQLESEGDFEIRDEVEGRN